MAGDSSGAGGGALPDSVAEKFKYDLEEAWNKKGPWSLSGSVDLKDKGAEIDVQYRDPLELQPKYNDDDVDPLTVGG